VIKHENQPKPKAKKTERKTIQNKTKQTKGSTFINERVADSIFVGVETGQAEDGGGDSGDEADHKLGLGKISFRIIWFI